MAKEKATLANVEGFIKHIIGRCSDQEPHGHIAKKLWELLSMVRHLPEFEAYQRAWLQGFDLAKPSPSKPMKRQRIKKKRTRQASA
jgi:hypothetical protein